MSTTWIDDAEIKAGSIIVFMKPCETLSGEKIEGKFHPCHYGIFTPKRACSAPSMVHVAWQGLKCHTLEDLYGHLEKLGWIVQIFPPKNEILGAQVAEQALKWYRTSEVCHDIRANNLKTQLALLGQQTPYNILDTLKMALRRETAYRRFTGHPVASRGTQCTSFVIDCYNATQLGKVLDARLGRSFSCAHEYVSIKYAHPPNPESNSYAWKALQEAQALRATVTDAYTVLLPGQTSRYQVIADDDLLLPEKTFVACQNADDALGIKAYQDHVRGKSPVDYLPPEFQTKEALEDLTRGVPIPHHAKFTMPSTLYDFLTSDAAAPYFEKPLSVRVSSPSQHLEASEELWKADQAQLIRGYGKFWKEYSDALLYRQILEKLFKHGGFRFSKHFVFNVPPELLSKGFTKISLEAIKHWNDITQSSHDDRKQLQKIQEYLLVFQKQFVGDVKKFRDAELKQMLDKILQQPLTPVLRKQLTEGFGQPKFEQCLKNAITSITDNLTLYDDSKQIIGELQTILTFVSAYVAINQLLKELHEALVNAEKQLAPYRLTKEAEKTYLSALRP